MATGTVKFYNNSKGFGFIKSENTIMQKTGIKHSKIISRTMKILINTTSRTNKTMKSMIRMTKMLKNSIHLRKVGFLGRKNTYTRSSLSIKLASKSKMSLVCFSHF